jgi:hypothetical protein
MIIGGWVLLVGFYWLGFIGWVLLVGFYWLGFIGL